MTEGNDETNRGMQWIRERFADVLGLTPDALEWERHGVGPLLQIPIADSKHYVCFEPQQVAECTRGEGIQNQMHTWIADHAKEAQRSPASRQDPHKCPVKPSSTA